MTFLDSLLEPLLRVNVDGVAAEAATLTSEGPALVTSGAAVHSTWQGLSGVYIAPEAPTLFAATLPIQEQTAALGQEVATVGAALTTFATEVRALQVEARALIAEAAAMEAQAASLASSIAAAGGDTNGADPMAAERDRLLAAAAALMARFNQAEITCANQIRTLAGGAPLVANNGDGVLADNEYGLTADQFIEAWGGTGLHRTVPGGVATAFTGDLEGLAGLVTGDPDTWLGLWRVGANFIPGVSIANNYVDLPGLPRGAAAQALLDAGKGMLAWDEWQRNPANAFGQVLYNFGTLPLVVGKFGTAGRLGGTAARLGETALRGLDAAAAATRVRIGDLARAAGTSLADLRVPTLHVNRSPALAGVGPLGGLHDVTVGSRRLGDTSLGQRMGIVTDPPSRGGHSPSSDGTPGHIETDQQSPRGGNGPSPDETPGRSDADPQSDTSSSGTESSDPTGSNTDTLDTGEPGGNGKSGQPQQHSPTEPPPGVTFDNRRHPRLGSDDKYYIREGIDHDVPIDEPGNLSRTITDIDNLQDGVLWEEKSAINAGDVDKWVNKQVSKKIEAYIEARQHIAGHENAPVGIEFTRPGTDPAFRTAVEQALTDLRAKHPNVDIRVRWAE